MKDFNKLRSWLSAPESEVYGDVIVENHLVKPWSFEHCEKHVENLQLETEVDQGWSSPDYGFDKSISLC